MPTLRALAAALILGITCVWSSHAQVVRPSPPPPPPVSSSCAEDNRVSHTATNCLEATWRNQAATLSSYPSTTWEVRNACAGYGEMVVRVQLTGSASSTHTLGNDSVLSRSNPARTVEAIDCCADQGMCVKSDVVTPESCLTRFASSGAGTTCTGSAATVESETLCVLTAQCPSVEYPSGATVTKTVEWLNVPWLLNCSGTLKGYAC